MATEFRQYRAGELDLTYVVPASQYGWIRDRSRQGCFQAFRESHWIGLMVFVGVVLDTQFPRPFG